MRFPSAPIAFIILAPLFVLGCGGVSSSQMVARDKATAATCDRYQACMMIGPEAGKAYTSRSSCDVSVRANWETAWPAAECDGKINQAQLDVCLSAIAATECMNALDAWATILVKCPKAKVCPPPDAAP